MKNTSLLTLSNGVWRSSVWAKPSLSVRSALAASRPQPRRLFFPSSGRLLPQLFSGVARLFLVAVLFSVTALRAEDKIFYPQSKEAASLTQIAPEATKANPVATSVVYLIFLAGLAYAAYILWQRKVVPQKTIKTALNNLDIVTTRPLGNRQFLVVVRYKKKELLLGVGQGFITRLECDSASTPSAGKKESSCVR